MDPADIYRLIKLDNGLAIMIRDLTRVYFGDYYLVRVEIVCRKDIPAGREDGSTLSGSEPGEFRRIVEKMGVPSAEIESARELLVDDFLNNTRSYLSNADFPDKLSRFAARQPTKIVRAFTGA